VKYRKVKYTPLKGGVLNFGTSRYKGEQGRPCNLEKLEYRSIDFNIEIIKNMNYFQPKSVINYPNKDVPYTRIIEYKHFLHQKSNDTIIVSQKQMNLPISANKGCR
jgi:UDP-galactopyranose mutase